MRALSFEFSRKSLIFMRTYLFPKKLVLDRLIFGPSRPGVCRRHFESWILQIDSQLEKDWFCNEDLDKTDLERYQEVLQSVRNPSHPKIFQQIQGFRRCKITWRKWNFVRNNLDFRTISCLKWSQTYGILWYSMVKWSHNWFNVHLMSNFVFSSTFRSRSFDEFISTFKLVRNSFSEFVRHFVIWWSYPQVLLANFG